MNEVYLDHLIERESLRYKRSDERIRREGRSEPPRELRLCDLYGDHMASRAKLLRKPDFQRATWAWTPEDCVSLLESLVNGQVVPSIIMWSSPENGYQYVLDGGHRVSVVLAWLNDDWGDHLSEEEYADQEQEDSIKKAAREVRRLVKERVGDIRDYQAADTAIERAMMENKAPRVVLPPVVFSRGMFYRALRGGEVGFHILWVTGDYEKAEQSFLKINKSGRQLSDWERKLVDNRNSSFARAIMSLANISSAKHYWDTYVPDAPNKAGLEQKVTEILTWVEEIHNVLFKPAYQTPIRSLTQPMLVTPDRQTRPVWLAELLTVIEGGRGQSAETEELLKRDTTGSPETMIVNGWKLIGEVKDVFSNLVGASPKSLGLVPALYFYTDSGRYVRSLLYGLIYWLLAGADEDIVLRRKRVFCAHRSALEQVLLQNKEDIVTGITRKTGSGPDVTLQTAQYYQRLLELLVKHNSQIDSAAFQKEYAEVIGKLTDRKVRPPAPVARSRTFTEKQKSTLVLRALCENALPCGICGGILDPSGDVQHDHIVEHFRGGQTEPPNQRITHPFCNNQSNREIIEALRAGQPIVTLPLLMLPELERVAPQLSFISVDPNFGL